MTDSVAARAGGQVSDTELLATLFDLGREVTSVLELNELLEKIPQLIARLTTFSVFAVYLLDEHREELRIAYAVGYPEDAVKSTRLKVNEGLVGVAVAEQRPILVNDVASDPRYIAVVPGAQSDLVVPLRHKGQVLGAINLLSDQKDAFTDRDEAILRQFGSHVAQAMELLTRVAHLVTRLIAYRTFGIALLDPDTEMLEMKIAISYGDTKALAPRKLGEGLVGYAALHKEPVLVPDVSTDSRYINAVSDVRSELVIPLLLKERCIGVFDLESPELDAFSKKHVELLTLLASQTAVAIENARLYEAIRDNEERLEREVRFAQRVQLALLPRDLPKKVRGVDVAWHFDPARELGGDLYEFQSPEPHTLVVALGDVSGKGVPAALYGAFVGEVIRSRTLRRRLAPDRISPNAVLTSINRIMHERQLEEYYCTLCYALFDLRKRHVTLSNSGLPYPIRASGDTIGQIELPGLPLGSFGGSTYDEISFDLNAGDLFVFCSDGIFEAWDTQGREFGADGIINAIAGSRDKTADEVVSAVFNAMQAFRGGAEQADDQTVVAVRITQ